MNTFKILLAVACLVAAISASPVKKNVKITKNAKSGKYTAHQYSIEEILEDIPVQEAQVHVHHAQTASSAESALSYSSVEAIAEVVHDRHHHHVPESSVETVDIEVIPEEDEIIVHEVVNVEGVGEIPIDVEIRIDEKAAEEVFHHHQEAAAPQHGGSFFNTHFADINGVSVALGNSFSTGDHGHSISKATANGPQHTV